ncbi:MAG: hypothetical protein IPL52_11180 [Flavobacteriales bacterium]|nr:hypothetical protein [Flavobacteriales bacterium]
MRPLLALGGDAQGFLLVGTAGRGLFPAAADRFVRITSTNGMDAQRIQCIQLDGEGRCWVGTRKGLYAGLERWRPAHRGCGTWRERCLLQWKYRLGGHQRRVVHPAHAKAAVAVAQAITNCLSHPSRHRARQPQQPVDRFGIARTACCLHASHVDGFVHDG